MRILSPHAVQLMTTNQIGDLKSPRGLGFGFGFETHDKYGVSGMASVGSWGWGGAYGTWYRVDPEERLTMVLMLQMIPNDTDIRDKFDAALFQALDRLNADIPRFPANGATGLPYFFGAIQRSILASRTSSGIAPSFSTSSWNAFTSNFLPSAFSARLRSSTILSWPILYASAWPGNGGEAFRFGHGARLLGR